MIYIKIIQPNFYIKHIKREDANGPIAEIYKNFPPEIMIPGPVLIKSIVPELAGINASELGYFVKAKLAKVFTAIRYILAVKVNSAYCTNVNGTLLKGMGFNDEMLSSLVKDETSSAFTAKENVLIPFAVKATMQPESINKDDINKVKSEGWTDEEMLQAVTNAIDSVAGINVFKVFQVKEK